MTRTVESIQNILQSDYVVTFRAYIPVDGAKHILKLGIEYPSGSGKVRYESAEMEAIAPPQRFPQIREAQDKLHFLLPTLSDSDPYLKNDYEPTVQHVKQ